MKTTGKIGIALGVLVVLAAAVVLLLTNLDRIVAAAIEKYGSEAVGTKVTVSSVRIGLKEGTGSIRDLRVGNPPGFSGADAIRLEDISVDVDTGSVTGDPLVIDKIVVRAPHVSYETDDSGRSNIDAIRAHLEKRQAAGAGEKKEAAAKEGKKILIRRLIVEKGTVAMASASRPGKPLTVPLPRIELTDLGGKDGDSPGDIASQIAGPLTRQASGAASGVGRTLEKGVKGVRETLKNLFGR